MKKGISKLIICLILFCMGCTSVNKEHVYVLIETELGDIKVKLYNETPLHRDNFVKLVKEGYYDGLLFHRVIKDFMIQGGDPEGNGTGGPGYSIAGEFSSNGYEENDLKHIDGVLSMARARSNDSAGSQFFIMVGEFNNLDGQYAAFGKVISGLDIVKNISKVATDNNDKPKEAVVIESITVDTNGVNYPEVEKIN